MPIPDNGLGGILLTEQLSFGGGPAYPVGPIDLGNGAAAAHPGMSLRDWFAGQVLPSVVAVCGGDTRNPGESREDYFARKAFSVADAMLKARMSEIRNERMIADARVAAIRTEHDRRVTELLEANNALLERARAAEANMDANATNLSQVCASMDALRAENALLREALEPFARFASYYPKADAAASAVVIHSADYPVTFGDFHRARAASRGATL